jgi:hypothetical protein
MLTLFFTVHWVAAVVFLFWQLKASDQATAGKLRASLAEEAGVIPARSAVHHNRSSQE